MKRFEIVPAGRPDASNEEVAWVAMLRRGLSPIQQSAFDRGDFIECDACAAKTGAPVLCAGCLANRHIHSLLMKELRKR